ncbi:hypothetical protein BH23BAC1_BH23BAC1_51720 [soil metagenome]
MNKLIIILLVVLILLWMITPLIEYFKSRSFSKVKFQHNALRHFNHVVVAIFFLFISFWLFSLYDKEFHVILNSGILLIGSSFLILSLITFYLYFNYRINQKIELLIYNLENGTLEINGEVIRRNSIQYINWHKIRNKKLIMIWSNFEYVEIIMNNGTRYVLSSLLLNLMYLSNFFQNLSIRYYDSKFPRIKG